MWAGLEAKDLEDTWMCLENHMPPYSLIASFPIKRDTSNGLEDSLSLLIPNSTQASLLSADDNELQGYLAFP